MPPVPVSHAGPALLGVEPVDPGNKACVCPEELGEGSREGVVPKVSRACSLIW